MHEQTQPNIIRKDDPRWASFKYWMEHDIPLTLQPLAPLTLKEKE